MLIAAEGRVQRFVEPEEIFRREVIDRHRIPGETSPASGTKPGGAGADVDRVAIAADRACSTSYSTRIACTSAAAR